MVLSLQGEIAKVGAQLKQRDRLQKELEMDLKRETQRYSELHHEAAVRAGALDSG
jgi:hypothetical protein